MLYPEKSMVNMMESSLTETMVSNTTNMYDPMVSTLLRFTVTSIVIVSCHVVQIRLKSFRTSNTCLIRLSSSSCFSSKFTHLLPIILNQPDSKQGVLALFAVPWRKNCMHASMQKVRSKIFFAFAYLLMNVI